MISYEIERLDAQDRSAFRSGSEALDRYLKQQARQEQKRRIASCFLAIANDASIAGYYTIAATALAADRLGAEHSRSLPRYPLIPAVLLGRLAVDLIHQRNGLGAILVANAIRRASRAEIMAYTMVVKAKDEAAAGFYAHLGFERLADDPKWLIRPLRTKL